MPLTEDYLKSVSESQLKDRAYIPYELERHERASIEEIRRCIKLKNYKDKETLKESLDFIETLSNKMNIAIQNQKKDNKTTWELEADLNDLKKVFDQLNNMLTTFETNEVDASVRKANYKRR